MKISVIIPAFNVDKHISECLDSLLVQSYKDVEIICVDDCSSDNTYSILQLYKERHPDIILLRNEINKGAPFSRNKGLELARGEYVQFLDADDILLPEKLKSQVAILQSCGNYPAVIVGDYIRVDLNNSGKSYISEKTDIWYGLLQTRLGITSSNLWSKSFLQAIGGWSTEYASSQEYELMFRILKKNGSVVFDKEENTVVRDRKSGSISTKNYKLNWMRYCDLRARIMDHILINNINVSKHNTYYQVLFDSIRTLSKYDFHEANNRFKKNIPNTFMPERSDVTSGLYLALYKLVGFKIAERIKQIFS